MQWCNKFKSLDQTPSLTTTRKGWSIMANSKAVSVIGNSCDFLMEVTKNKTAGTPEHKIVVTVDVTGVSRETMLSNNFSGSSMRVKLQSIMRRKTEVELSGYEKDGYRTTWTEIDAGTVQTLKDRLMAMNVDQFVEFCEEQFEMEYEDAIKLFNRKHGISEDEDE